jgi:4-carboxymuconolactone decarboxylase
MAKSDQLGGRLPLLGPSDLSDKQKEIYQRMRTNQVPWSTAHNIEGMTDDERLIGPCNPLLYSPGEGMGFLDFEGAEDRSSSLDQRVRQVVILSVGSVWRAAYEIYAHTAVARLEGLSDESIKALANRGGGERPDQERASCPEVHAGTDDGALRRRICVRRDGARLRPTRNG